MTEENMDKHIEQPTEPAAAPVEPMQPATEPVVETPLVGETVVMPPEEVEKGKAFAILSYAISFVGLPFFLVPLIMRDNDFSLYHAKQSLMVWIIGAAGGVIGGILMAVCIGVIVLPVVGIFTLVINIMGLINAIQGVAKPLPLVGKWAEDWFKGITKAA